MDLVSSKIRQILDAVQSITAPSVPELEVRIKDIERVRFQVLLGELKAQPYERTVSTDYFIDGSRHSIINPSQGTGTFTHKIIEKRPVWKHDDNEYNVRISVAAEIPSQDESLEMDIYKDAQSTHTRSKDRISVVFGNVVRVDATMVVSTGRGFAHNSTSYEVEVELVGDYTVENLRIMDETITYLFMIIQESRYIYTVSQAQAIAKDYNEILEAPIGSRTKGGKEILSHAILVQARNLKSDDCTSGGLVGGKYRYSLTNKARGNRKQLMIHSSGIWLLFPPYNFTLIMPRSVFGKDTRILDGFGGTIIDGEDIPKDQRTHPADMDLEHYFLPFDIMATKGKRDVQNIQNHSERMQPIASFVKSPIFSGTSTVYRIIKIAPKEFVPIESYDSFSKALAYLAGDFGYSNDGYIITPINSPYMTDYGDVPLHARTLREYPEICKLKPWKELTIDFEYENAEGQRSLNVTRKKSSVTARGRHTIELVPFGGSPYHPFDQVENVDWGNIFFAGLAPGSIVEMEPHQTEGGVVMRPLMVRHNKTHPNTEEIAKAVWDDIQKPLTVDILTGKRWNLLFQYHNVEKRQLLSQIPKGAHIVEIGGGRGGDLSKIRQADRIISIDPNSSNQEEYKRRASIPFKAGKTGKMEQLINKITLLNTEGENTEAIVTAAYRDFGWDKTPTQPLYIIMMLSLSFFFGPENPIENLGRTVKQLASMYYSRGGKHQVRFIFMTIEGNRVLSLFKSKGMNDIHLGPTHMILSENSLYINIPNSIVTQQTEFLVDLAKMQTALGLENLRAQTCNRETFLSPDEIAFTSLFVTGSAVIKAEKKEVPDQDAVVIHAMEKLSIAEAPILETQEGVYMYQQIEKPNFFDACAVCLGTPERDLRKEFAVWLCTPDPRYTPQTALTLYGGGDPRAGSFATQVQPNINYYTALQGRYNAMFANIAALYKGLDYMVWLLGDMQYSLPHAVLEPMASFIKFNIRIYTIENGALTMAAQFDYGSGPTLLLLESAGSYYPVGFKKSGEGATVYAPQIV